MQEGIIARMVKEKGFGFIKREGEAKDLFFHSNETNGAFDSLNEGDKVSFEVADSPKGPNAVQVAKVA